MKRALSLLCCLLTLRCTNAPAPTTTSESDASLLQRAYDFEKGHRPIKIQPETIVLDVRAFFDYQILRLPGSIYVDPNEFTLRRLHGDDLEEQAVKMARRFALMGINPFSHVVVVGYGAKGKGEEGTVALTLLALGVERVQIATFESFKFLASTKQAPVPPNKRYWEPKVVTTVSCPAHSQAEGFVIDVGGGKGNSSPAFGKPIATLAKNWKDFVNADDFSPNYKARDLLKKNGLDENSMIMVRGTQAPVVVFSLLQMGFPNTCLSD